MPNAYPVTLQTTPISEKNLFGLRVLTNALCLAGLISPVYAQPGPPETAPVSSSSTLRFDIPRYEVIGPSRLNPAQMQKLLEPYTGVQKTADDVNAARAALQTALQNAGQTTAQVSLPEQTAGAAIRLVVTDQNGLRLKSTTILGANAAYTRANIQASLPALQPGQRIDESRLERNLRLANLNPGKQTSVDLQPTAKAAGATGAAKAGALESVNAQVSVRTSQVVRGVVSLDNTGDEKTGRARLGLGLSHSNVTGHDDVLAGQFITSPSQTDKVQVYAVNYSVPLYKLDSQVETYALHSNAKLGVVQNLFNANGQGDMAGVRWNYLLPAIQGIQPKASLAYDAKSYKNDITLVGTPGSLLPDVKVKPLSLGLSFKAETAFAGHGSVHVGVGYSRNMGRGSSDAATFNAARSGAVPNYALWSYNLAATLRAQPSAASWGGRVQLAGQSSTNALVYGEQFGLGGANSVRGYREREFIADSGYSARNELFTPNLTVVWPALAKAQVQDVRFKAFADVGYGKRNFALPGEPVEFRPASVGVGLSVQGQQSWGLNLDVARVQKTLGSRTQGDIASHFSLVKMF